MLKNKKAIYILILLNTFIWSFCVYRFYSAYTDSNVSVIETNYSPIIKAEKIEETVAYKLDFNYKDPFLKGVKSFHPNAVSAPNISEQNAPKKIVVEKMPTAVPKQLPEIKYLGLIKNNTSGLINALVSVNGQSKLIKPNETFEGVLFKSFNKDSLVAKWGKERIVARK